jgi:hypothetical protein
VADAAVLPDVGLYFYCVVPAGTDTAGLHGLDDVEVETVEHGGVSAVVSKLSLDRPPGRSAELVAHARVVDALAAVTDVVPAQFGSALDNDLSEVAGFLDDEGDRIRSALSRLGGKVQLNLRASYEPDQVLAELVQQDPLVAELRSRTRELPSGVPHPDLVRLGEAVSRGLTRKRVEDAESLLDVVLPHVSEHIQRPGGEYDVLDAALLVERSAMPTLEQALEELAEVVHERIRMRLVGPVAPYDFVEDVAWV